MNIPHPPSLASSPSSSSADSSSSSQTSPAIASAIHLEFIRTVIDSGDDDAANRIEDFHQALFLNQHGKDLERFRLARQTHEERLAALENRLRQTRDRLVDQQKFLPSVENGIPDDRPTAPWNLWDRTMFASAALAILALLAFGVLNISFNLLESGIATFTTNPWRAYLWTALLPVGALAVKVGWDFLRSPALRDTYLWACLAAGVLAVFAWIAAYATAYPTLSQSASERIDQLSVFSDTTPESAGFWDTTHHGIKRIDMLLVAAQAVAEICLSAALGMYMTQLYNRHRPVRLAPNPSFIQFDQHRQQLELEVERERDALASARGDQGRLEHQLSVFVAYARSLYQRELANRKDRIQQKRALIEDMAEQLRSRLEAIDRLPDLPGPSDSLTDAPRPFPQPGQTS